MAFSVFFLVLLMCAFQATANEETRSENMFSPQELVDTWMANHTAGAVAVALVSPNSTQFYYAGDLKPNSSSLPNEETMFEIGSVTKGFTGLLLADQVLSGKVSLNDTLSDLLTDWPGRFSSAAGNVTLFELATHTSGLTRLPANMDLAYITQHIHDPYAAYDTEKLYAWLDIVEAPIPGNYSYSNAGYGILGHALAIKAGKSYEDILKERILEPLGLGNTTITLNDDQINRLAAGHDGEGNVVQRWDFDVLAPCGALRSSLTDLNVFVQLAAGIKEVKKSMQDVFEFATRCRITALSPHVTVGLGWHRSDGNGLLVFHNGATGGYNAFVGWYPEHQTAVVVMSSITATSNSVDHLAIDLLKWTLKNVTTQH